MTLGDIKIQTLKLMEINDEDISTITLPDLADNENYKGYLSRMPSAVGRALSRIKSAGALDVKTFTPDKPFEETKYITKIKLSEIIEDYSRLKRVIMDGENMYVGNYPFTMEGRNTVVLKNVLKGWTPTFVYDRRIPIYTAITPDDTELDVCEELAAIIPYFVKADVFEQDEPSLAAQARNIFEQMLSEYEPIDENVTHCIDEIYSQGW